MVPVEVIQSLAYQKFAERCVLEYLSLKNKTLKCRLQAPVRLRMNAQPPSVQIVKMPEGGISEGVMRIKCKLQQPVEIFTNDGILLPCDLLLISENDLTSESILLTLENPAMSTLLAHDLISNCEAKVLLSLCNKKPNTFLILHRYLMGIERDDQVSVPFSVVGLTDQKILKELAQLPAVLRTL